jgi:hypothetical protein
MKEIAMNILIAEAKIAVAAAAAAQAVYVSFGSDGKHFAQSGKFQSQAFAEFAIANPLAPAEALWRFAASQGVHAIMPSLDGQSPWLSVPLPVRMAYETFRMVALRLAALRDEEQTVLAANEPTVSTPFANSLQRTFEAPLPFSARTVLCREPAPAAVSVPPEPADNEPLTTFIAEVNAMSAAKKLR